MEHVVRLELTSEPAFVSDESGRIVGWNDGARALLGYEAAEVVGRRCCEVIQGLDIFGNCYCTEHCNPMEMIERGAPLHGFELDVRKASGERVRAAFSLFVVSGRPSSYTIVHLMRPAATEPRDAEAGAAAGRRRRTAGEASKNLSQREIQVLRLLAEGATTQGISNSLSISTATVRTHVQNILRKLGAHSKLEAVAVAQRDRLL